MDTQIGDPTNKIEGRIFLQSLIDSSTCLLTFDEKGIIQRVLNIAFATERFALLSETPTDVKSDEDCIGLKIDDVWPDEFLPIVQIVTQRALSTGEDSSLEHTLADSNRNPIHLKLRAAISDINEQKQFHVSVTDITAERIKANRLDTFGRNLAEANTRLRLALNGSKVTIFEHDLDLRYTFMANRPDFMEELPIGRTDADLFGDFGAELLALKRETALAGKPWSGRIDVPDKNGSQISYDVELEPRFSTHGDVIGLIGTAIDLSDLKQHEDAMRLAMREITHRTKNLLAVIQATARRTASKAASKEEFVESFANRLSAMSQSHDLLVRSNWAGADMAELITRNARQAGTTYEGSFVIEGPSLTLTSDAAQHFGMALHELVSNALKYGALSVNGGQVEATWKKDGDDIVFHWEERGGPNVTPPSSSGFGTSYLQRAVAMALNAKTDLAFEPAGLQCTIKLPGECFY